MPIAAIEALVLLLSHSPVSTISETLDLLETHANRLKKSIPNPIGLSAGTDLFQRYIVTTLQRQGKLGPTGDFSAIRAHLLSNGRLFIKRAKESRDRIAALGKSFVRDGCTILTNGDSRVVGALLKRAADDSKFRVVYVIPHKVSRSGQPKALEGMSMVAALRSKGVPVATIPESAVAFSMGMVDMVIVGAEGVVENGGIISRLGTYQIALLAKTLGRPFYVVAESHKFVRLYPLGQYDLPVDQQVVDFVTDVDKSSESKNGPTAVEEIAADAQDSAESIMRQAVDFTPPHLISALITESGVLTPSAVSEELIKIWF
jgi:translation initiation factor eIF-2B subunit alpha